MSNVTAKTASNIYFVARCNAAKHNEQLSSREGAADLMSIDRGRLYRIESGVTNPYPEEVHLMADLYNAPELRNNYCRECCPLGSYTPQIDTDSLDRITVRALSSFRRLKDTKKILLDITEDGVITEDERPALEEVLKEIEEVSSIAHNLRAWMEKNM